MDSFNWVVPHNAKKITQEETLGSSRASLSPLSTSTFDNFWPMQPLHITSLTGQTTLNVTPCRQFDHTRCTSLSLPPLASPFPQMQPIFDGRGKPCELPPLRLYKGMTVGGRYGFALVLKAFVFLEFSYFFTHVAASPTSQPKADFIIGGVVLAMLVLANACWSAELQS